MRRPSLVHWSRQHEPAGGDHCTISRDLQLSWKVFRLSKSGNLREKPEIDLGRRSRIVGRATQWSCTTGREPERQVR